MTRPRNPNGDSVAIRKMVKYMARYYLTGVIADPTSERSFLASLTPRSAQAVGLIRASLP